MHGMREQELVLFTLLCIKIQSEAKNWVRDKPPKAHECLHSCVVLFASTS